MIRVATYISQIPTALEMVKDAHDKGYETTVNLMAVTTVPERELNEGLELLAALEVGAVYVVDSFGALYSEQVHYLCPQVFGITARLPARKWACTRPQPAARLPNTIEAIIEGANHAGRHHGWVGTRRGELPDGTVDRLSSTIRNTISGRSWIACNGMWNLSARN